jgi:hypothetical protein
MKSFKKAPKMKKALLFFLVALVTCDGQEVLAVGTMGMSISPTRPNTNGGYFWDNGAEGGNWSNYADQWSDPEGTYPRLAWMEVFKLSNSQTLSGYAFQLYYNLNNTAPIYVGSSPETNLLKLELWDLTGNRVAAPSPGNTLIDSWTGTLDSALDGQGDFDWFTIALSNTKTLNAGTFYGLTMQWVNKETNVDYRGRRIRPYVDQNYIQHPVEPQFGGNPANRTTSSRINGDPTLAASYGDVYYNPNFALIAGSPGVTGDYNNNGVVDAADYVLWRKGSTLQNDPTAGVQPGDYDVWRAQFGKPPGAGSSLTVGAIPEPGAALLIALAIGLIGCFRRFRIV